jgi:hypothetical protein
MNNLNFQKQRACSCRALAKTICQPISSLKKSCDLIVCYGGRKITKIFAKDFQGEVYGMATIV